MPVQDFGNAFSTFIAQNFGARRQDRIRRGIRCAWLTTTLFAGIVSILVFFFASIRTRNHINRCRLSANRRKLLHRNRLFIPVLRIFPSSIPSFRFPYSDNYFTRNKSHPCLFAGRYPEFKLQRHLVVCSHRLDLSRYCRCFIL